MAGGEVTATALLSKPKPSKLVRVKKRKQKTPRQIWERKLDDITREIVLARDSHCVLVGNHSEVLQCGHLISRVKRSVRWDLFNCNAQCSGCNQRHEWYPERYTLWFVSRVGAENYARLCAEAERANKLTTEELERLHMELLKIRQYQKDCEQQGAAWCPRFSQSDVLDGTWRAAAEAEKG